MTPDLIYAAASNNYGVGAAIVIAVGGFAYAIYNGVRTERRSGSTANEQLMSDRITDLVRQVAEYKDEAQECSRQRKALERENVQLMRQVMQLKNGDE